MSQKGLVIVNTGNGKGKTTAALGLAVRALGHNLPVCMVQFIKGTWKYGEIFSAKRFEGLLDFHVLGNGFTWNSQDPEHDKQIARNAWEFAERTITSNQYRLVILDELTYLINYGFIEEQRVLACLQQRHKQMHVVITGRDASPGLLNAADLVTAMQEVKHPYQHGILAQKGIEF